MPRQWARVGRASLCLADPATNIGSDLEPDRNRRPSTCRPRMCPTRWSSACARAARHRRSLHGELLAIVEAAVSPPAQLTPAEVLAEIQRLQLTTPAEAAALVHAGRNRS